jgi:hypothetical protein
MEANQVSGNIEIVAPTINDGWNEFVSKNTCGSIFCPSKWSEEMVMRKENL